MTARRNKIDTFIQGRSNMNRFVFLLFCLFSCSGLTGCGADENENENENGTDAPSEALTNYVTTYDDDSVENNIHFVRAYYIVPKVASLLSFLGSSAIIAEVWGERQKHSLRSSPSIGWLLMSMSISDIVYSAVFFVGNWAVPSDTPYVWQAKGNTASCDAQGFFNQLGWAATPLFSLALSVYFLLIIRYNWKEGQLRKLDPWVHGSIWLLSLVLAAIPIPLGLYNDSFGVCWLEAYPYGCSTADDDWPCTRGHHAAAWALIYFVFPALVCLLLSTIVMGMLYQTVRKMETDRMTNVLQTSSGEELQLNSVDRKRSRKVGMQAIYYLGVYYVVMVPMFVVHILYQFNDGWYNPWTDLIAYSILLPMLGFFNFLVFASRRDQMYTSYGRFLSRAVCCFGITGAVLRQSTVYFTRLSTGISGLSTMSTRISTGFSIQRRSIVTSNREEPTSDHPSEQPIGNKTKSLNLP